MYLFYCVTCFGSYIEPSLGKKVLKKTCHMPYFRAFMFELRSRFTYHTKYMLSRKYSLQNVYVEQQYVNIFLEKFPVKKYGMSKLIFPHRIVNIGRWCWLWGCCVYFLRHMYSLRGKFCCHRCCIFLYYFPVTWSSHKCTTSAYKLCNIPCCVFGFCALSLLEKLGNTFSSSSVHVDSMNKEISYTGSVTLLLTSFTIENYWKLASFNFNNCVQVRVCVCLCVCVKSRNTCDCL